MPHQNLSHANLRIKGLKCQFDPCRKKILFWIDQYLEFHGNVVQSDLHFIQLCASLYLWGVM